MAGTLTKTGGSTDPLQNLLKSSQGASEVATASGLTVQEELDSKIYTPTPPDYFKSLYQAPIVGTAYPQGIDESPNYYFVMIVDRSTTPIRTVIQRIHKETLVVESTAPILYADTHNLIVLDDNTIIFPTPDLSGAYGYVNTLTKYHWLSATTSTMPIESFNSSYGFTWDGVDTIYQLDIFNQAVAAGDVGDGRFDQIRTYSLKTGLRTGIIPMPREMVREGFVQDIHYYQEHLYFFTGGSFSGTEDANKRVTSIYMASLAGLMLDGKNYRADSFASQIGINGIAGLNYEAQGISIRGNKFTCLIYVGQAGFGTNWHIIRGTDSQDVDGKPIRQGIGSTSYIRHVQYNEFAQLNASNASLAASGDAIGYLAGRMLNNSTLECALDSASFPAITTQLGITAGSIYIHRNNPFRIIGEVTTPGGATDNPVRYYFSVFNRQMSPLVRSVVTRNQSLVLYQGSVVEVNGNTRNVNWSAYSTHSILVSNFSSANPCGVHTYTAGQLKYFGSILRTITLTNGAATLVLRITPTGYEVVSVTGSPVITHILAD